MLVMPDFSCDYLRCIFAREKEFYSANEANVLTNEEDATKSFNSVNPTTKQLECHNWDKRKTMWVIQDHNSGLRTWPKK